ncbi:MAG TPA: multidrug efflux RND transporter permease subunit [Zoogloea sp.]|uniref:efflux RND transporter permease subunit n=1 Tax=Zoogloea sp. TaxID=49181 RepID=UPI002BDF7026|nr:multidrug efflux RND transporter permease subunit [Zoogloea sp.]HMW51249.1 multidrug efflux RND transporter permease subunit [Rhodocyclaceae bacterium]HMY48964.1 multidrug efflux RND transporter permease subunit [Rhodocyclaceae bacterium]HNB64190.1 multidrug efflux RND transporter permease subunit [Rhodocyclaceae bacterium]HNC78467.1 multidrug efflux RND transporter permease subunit [Rhodocyclaceae bacterium]HND23196.1 multidrug efflux RND transporter permease subunit [Rhodocyclaceae bacter
MSRFFISRPIFASVISIIIVIAGLMASLTLPVAQYPEITPPTIIISASYPGANAETLSKTVAAPIEEQLSGAEGLIYYNSQSTSNGTVTITATFEVGTNPDNALIAVNNRVKVAEPRLPDDVRRTGVLVQKRSNNILMFAAVRSPKGAFDTLYLSNYVALNIIEEIRRIPGVGDAQQFDAIYAMRVWLKPDVMAKLGITTTDIANAIRVQNTQNAAGKIGQEPVVDGQQLTYTVTAKGRLLTPEEFGGIILKAEGPNGIVRIRDVARIELGAENYDRSTAVNGAPVSGMGIYLQSGANALDTAKRVRARLDEMQKRFPQGMEYFIPYDTTRFIQESAHEVVKTLVEAALLVIAVVYLFLQSWRATLIPMVAVPVSLIGTFAGMWLFGFSINTLTLFAMVLAIGIVVDDAIVVLENVERLMSEQKLAPFDAAVEAMREVSGAVVAIVLVLCAVFVPVAFLGGIAGKLYQQFAVTVAVAVVISGIVALTLTPALCALLLKASHEEKPLFKPFNRLFERFTRSYTNTVGLTLRHGIIGTLVFLGTIGATAFLLRIVPGSFVPAEDQGYLFGFVTLTDGASAQRTFAASEQMRTRIMSDDIENIFFVNGIDFITGNNRASVATTFIIFKPWEQRSATADDMAKKFMGVGMSLSDGLGLVFNPPPIQGLGTAGGFEVYLQNRADGDARRLAQVSGQFLEALRKRPELTGLNSFFRVTAPQLYVEVDEPKALSMGISLDSIYATLQATTGTLYVNDFNRAGKTYKVELQAEAAYRMNPEDLLKPYVRTASGAMVPLSAVAKVKTLTGAEMVERFNGFVSAKVLGNAAPGFSSGQAIQAVEEVAREALPEGFQVEWVGQAFQEKRTGSASIVAFTFGIIMVFLILAAQFEKWSLPLAVIMAVPFAMFGALSAVLMRSMPNDIYFQIGLVVLVGLAAKNAILIVEFAAQKLDEGMGVVDAAVEAARLRFRPIVMTSLAFVLGVLPLALSTGAGAAARRSMGTGVVGGMLAATFIATIFVPLFFKWLSRKGKGSGRSTPPATAATEEVKS